MTNRKWTNEEDDLLQKEYKNKSYLELGSILNRSIAAIGNRCCFLGLNKNSLWSTEEIEILKQLYETTNWKDINKLLPNHNKSSIYRKAFDLGLKSDLSTGRKFYNCNEEFFSVPNPINSYWAGLIAADGYIRKNKYEVSLIQKDISVLEKFQNHINYNGNITITKALCGNIAISSKQLSNDLLENFNIGPQKSLTLEPPKKLNNYNSLCYAIGFYDGDGWISIISNRNIKVIELGCCGTKNILTWLQELFNGYGNIYPRSKIFNYYIRCKQAREIIYKLRSIEELKEIRFARKWDKILEWERLQNEKAIS